jgi:hypothetical protein
MFTVLHFGAVAFLPLAAAKESLKQRSARAKVLAMKADPYVPEQRWPANEYNSPKGLLASPPMDEQVIGAKMRRCEEFPVCTFPFLAGGIGLTLRHVARVCAATIQSAGSIAY